MWRLWVLIGALVLAGCETAAVDRAAIAPEPVGTVPVLRSPPVAVGPFTSTPADLLAIPCPRSTPITTPDGSPFADFVRQALVEALTQANAYDPQSPLILTGTLDTIAVSPREGQWHLALSVYSPNRRAAHIAESYRFPSTGDPATVCRQTAHALMPAVQTLIGKLLQSAEFQGLLQW